jgi:hypothetical protein
MSARGPMFRGDPNVRIGNFVVEITDVYGGRVSFANLPSGGPVRGHSIPRPKSPTTFQCNNRRISSWSSISRRLKAIGHSFCGSPIRLLNKAVGFEPNETQPKWSCDYYEPVSGQASCPMIRAIISILTVGIAIILNERRCRTNDSAHAATACGPLL